MSSFDIVAVVVFAYLLIGVLMAMISFPLYAWWRDQERLSIMLLWPLHLMIGEEDDRDT